MYDVEHALKWSQPDSGSSLVNQGAFDRDDIRGQARQNWGDENNLRDDHSRDGEEQFERAKGAAAGEE